MTLGPVQLLVIGFEGAEFDGTINAELIRLREAGVVRMIDLIVVHKGEDGVMRRIERSDLSEQEQVEFGALAGALIGFGAGGEEGAELGAELGAERALERAGGDDEVWFVDDTIPAGTAAAVALIEHQWAIPLRETIRAAGGFHLADAWIHPADLVGIGLLAAEEAELELSN